MEDNNKKVTPIIVNGELNTKRRNRKNNVRKDKLPKKSFGLSDILLSLIGFVLVIYGIYTILNKEPSKKTEDTPSNVQSNIDKDTQKENVKMNNLEKYIVLNGEEASNVYTVADLKNMPLGLPASNLSNNAKLALAMKLASSHVVDNETYILEEELDTSMKNLFGKDVIYTKSAFTLGNNVYTYNQETKRYYLMDNTQKINLNYQKLDYTEKYENGNKLIIREYVAYTDLNHTKSWTLNNSILTEIIDSNNIKEKYKYLKCYEYEFILNGDNYKLEKITIK